MYRGKKILIIVPAYNEEKSLKLACDRLKEYSEFDFVVVDDGSKDKTKIICKQEGYKYISLSMNLGIGGAVQTGYKYAYKNDYDIAIQFDGDGQHDESYILKLVDELLDGDCDFVIGSRFIGDESGFKSTVTRQIGIGLISFVTKLLTGKKVYDTTSGFRAANKEIIEMFAQSYPIDYPEPESTIVILESPSNYKISEIPVNMHERKGGKSSIRAWKTVHYMIVVLLSMVMAKVRRQ